MASERATWLTTYDLHRLDLAVSPLRRYCHDIYLVGTVLTSPDWRDVDVRMILDDEWFDAEFSNPLLWEVFCLSVTSWLRSETGLPIDFQVQRQSEANEKHPGLRNHLSGGRRQYAGLGDATPYNVASERDLRVADLKRRAEGTPERRPTDGE